MPAVITGNPAFPNQAGPNGTQAFVQQLTFGQMIREVTQWNPDLDLMVAGRMVNNAYRSVIRKRNWYALKVRGSINVPTVVQQGTCTITNGSTLVQGIGTAWTTNLIGLQFRAGFSYPWATIYNVNAGLQQITIDIPYGGATQTGGYQIQEVYATLGSNITYLLWATNQQQGWPIICNCNAETVNVWDTWRFSLGWTKYFFNRAPTPDGQFQIEMWPTPYQAQVFPFEAYTQPADMVLDSDSPVSFISADVILKKAISEAKLFGGRTSKYYDPYVAEYKMKEFNAEVEALENMDNGLDQQDVTWDYGMEDGIGSNGLGSTWAQSHDA